MSHPQDTNYHEAINEYAQEYQAELKDNLKLKNYNNQLRDVWLKMIKDYPHLYNILDYGKACNEAKLLIF